MAYIKSKVKSVCVIGAGQSGLVTMKTLLQCGYHVTTYEKQAEIGGLWQEKGSLLSPDLRMNTSVWSSVYSDFPPKAGNYDEFMTVDQYMDYLKAYADHFHLRRNIIFDHEVTKITRKVSVKTGTKWIVDYRKVFTNLTQTSEHDFVVVCSGAYNCKKSPDITRLVSYTGNGECEMVMTQDPGVVEKCKDKTVMVVGSSISGANFASKALENKAKKVYLSLTARPGDRSRWFISRYPRTAPAASRDSKIPWDMPVTRNSYFLSDQPYYRTYSHFMEPFLLKASMDKINPTYNNPTYGADNWMVEDVKILKQHEREGRLETVRNITQISDKDITCNDDKVVHDVDLLVVATGFKLRFPFLDHIWKEREQAKFELFNHMISLTEGLDGVFFVGLTPTPIGVFMVAEMQARWLGRQFRHLSYNSRGLLYTTEKRLSMFENIKLCKSVSVMNYNYIGDPYGYMDKLARQIGCFPACLENEFSESILQAKTREQICLTVAVFFGPFIAAHYQLDSPHSQVRDAAKQTSIYVARIYLGAVFEDYVQHYVNQNREISKTAAGTNGHVVTV